MPSLGPLARRLPMMRVLALAQVGLLAREHFGKLTPDERHRMLTLVSRAHGRPSNLNPRERDELRVLVSRLEAKAFLGSAARRMVGGRSKRK
jgi:hypothetical protein